MSLILTEDWTMPQEYLSYFELTYIGPERGGGSIKRRVDPIFNIKIWNLQIRIQIFITRQEEFYKLKDANPRYLVSLF